MKLEGVILQLYNQGSRPLNHTGRIDKTRGGKGIAMLIRTISLSIKNPGHPDQRGLCGIVQTIIGNSRKLEESKQCLA